MYYTCFNCGAQFKHPIHFPCPNCRIDIGHLDGTQTSSFQIRKWSEHLDLVAGRSINLYGKDWSCSFDSVGYSKITDIVEFTLNFGQKLQLPATRGLHINDVYLAFIPEVIGSGISTNYATLDTMPCSGTCIISPQSIDFGHPFPVLYDWVNSTWNHTSNNCKSCGRPTHIGQPFCWDCYNHQGGDWSNFLNKP
jgi:hypothetical protein